MKFSWHHCHRYCTPPIKNCRNRKNHSQSNFHHILSHISSKKNMFVSMKTLNLYSKGFRPKNIQNKKILFAQRFLPSANTPARSIPPENRASRVRLIRLIAPQRPAAALPPRRTNIPGVKLFRRL